MFQERLSIIIADHLRVHIGAYLEEVEGWFPGSKVATLVVPKSINTAGQVGGVAKDLDKILPAYAVDILPKTFAGVSDENLFLYQYAGHIAGMARSGSEESVNRIIKRHYSAVELFVKRHWLLHKATNDQFTVVEMMFVDSDFSGSEPIEEGPKEQWVAAFRIDLQITTSEDSYFQHE